MSRVNRRRFLSDTVKTGGVALAMQSFAARGTLAAQQDGPLEAAQADGSYRPLKATPAENTGEVFLELPEGFKYTVFGKTGSIMSDGRPTPAAHDGMATFEQDNGNIRLVRNHEVTFSRPGSAIDLFSAYDPTTGGGTTTLIINPATRLPIRDFVSLSGTHNNCAGGLTPWGSWITCEENVGGLSAGFMRPHGYAFEVPARSNRPVIPIPIKSMGRFVHEAVAVDPSLGIVYET